MYIVIEGQDATGKSTQVESLAKHFRELKKPVLTLHEPDGDLPQAHVLRDLIKDKNYHLDPLTHVVLFTAARVELWKKLAEPLLKDGGIVISARNWWSTLAYQGYGQGVSRSKIITLTKQLLPKNYVTPDHSVILTLNNQERLSRQKNRDDNSAQDTFESKSADFQRCVDAAYLSIAKDFNIPTFDASASPETTTAALLTLFGLG